MSNTAGLNLFDGFQYNTGTTTRAITTSNTKASAVMRAPKTGNIRYIGATFSALSGSPVLDVRLETLSGGGPSGTLYGTNTNGSYSPTLLNTFVWTQLTADAAVTEGDGIAAVIAYTSGTSATCVYATTTLSTASPQAWVMSSGTWGYAFAGTPMICAKYDDGTIIRGCLPVSQITSGNLQSGTNPNERATVFTPPFACTLTGVRLALGATSSATFTINLYSGTSTSPVSGGTITVAAGLVTSTAFPVVFQFPAAISLTASQQYRISVKATAAQNVSVFRYLFASTADRDMVMGEATSDTRNGSAWIGETTTTSEQIWPLFGSVTAGAGGGGSVIGSSIIRGMR